MQVSGFCVHTASSQQLNVNENGQYQEQKLTSRLKKKNPQLLFTNHQKGIMISPGLFVKISHVGDHNSQWWNNKYTEFLWYRA